ncbi:MAG: hypothetical protein JW394_0373 [Nitrospira sp.]|nr:hypothetical protein [Nitrospira sp.]
MLFDVVEQAFLILSHLEKVVMLAELLYRAFAVRAEAGCDILFRPKPFVEGAVPASVIGFVNQACIEELLKISLDG